MGTAGYVCISCGHRATGQTYEEERKREQERRRLAAQLEQKAYETATREAFLTARERWSQLADRGESEWPDGDTFEQALTHATPVTIRRIRDSLLQLETLDERIARETDERTIRQEAAARAAEKQAKEAKRQALVAKAHAERLALIADWNLFLNTRHSDLPSTLKCRTISEEAEQLSESMTVGQLVSLAHALSHHQSSLVRYIPSNHPLEFIDQHCVRSPGRLNVPRLCEVTAPRESARQPPVGSAGRDAPWHYRAFAKWQPEQRKRTPTTTDQPSHLPEQATRAQVPASDSAQCSEASWELGYCTDTGDDAAIHWEEELGPNRARTVGARLSRMFPNIIFAIRPESDADDSRTMLIKAGCVVTIAGAWDGAASVTVNSHAIELSAHLDEAWAQREIQSIDLNDLQVRDDALVEEAATPSGTTKRVADPDDPKRDQDGARHSDSHDDGTPDRMPLSRAGPQERPTFTNAAAGHSDTDLYPWQAEALTTWAAHGHRGIAEAVTGAGKTRLAIEALRQVLDCNGLGFILVPTRELMFQWQRELRKSLPSTPVRLLYQDSKGRLAPGAVLVSTIQSAITNVSDDSIRAHPALVIADEVHRYGSSEWRRSLLPAFDRRLGITATLERSDDGVSAALAPYFERRVIHVDHVRARREGAIAPYSIAFIGCRFLPAERRRFDNAQDQMSRVQPILANELNVDPHREFGKFILGVQRLSKSTNPDFASRKMARQWLKNFAERRRIMAEASGKLELLRMLAPCVQRANGTIIFAETKAATQTAAAVLSDYGIKTNVLHSDLAHDDRKQSLKEFEDDEVEVIAAPKLLDEGVNVPEADLAIVVANSRSKRQLIQRAGRVLRNKADGRQARIVVLYVEGTSEDPTSGTRQDFMDVITPAANAHAIFASGSSAVEIAQFVNRLFLLGD